MSFRTSGGTLTKQVQYTYDVYDRLIGKAVDDDGDGIFDRTERFVYDGDDVVLSFDGAGSLTHRYLHGDDVDQVFASEDALGEVLWALTDYQGTVRDVADYDVPTDTLTFVDQRTFDSFGNITSESNAAVDFRYAWTGRFFDADTGLQYNRARWFDPTVGRFISEDPIGFSAGDANLSRYVGNSPGNYTDPSGLAEKEKGFCESAWGDVKGLFRTGVRYSPIGAVRDTLRGDLTAPLRIVNPVEAMGRDGGKATAQRFLSDWRNLTESGKSVPDKIAISTIDSIGGILGGDNITNAWTGRDEDNCKLTWGARAYETIKFTGKTAGVVYGPKIVARGGQYLRRQGLILEPPANPAALPLRPQYLKAYNPKPTGGGQLSNAQLVDEVALRAQRWGKRKGFRNGATAGKKMHKHAEELLKRYQKVYGDRGLSTEVRYIDQREWIPGDGLKGTVRLDVVEGPLDCPTRVFDYKFGKAKLTQSRIVHLRKVSGIGKKVPFTPVKPKVPKP